MRHDHRQPGAHACGAMRRRSEVLGRLATTVAVLSCCACTAPAEGAQRAVPRCQASYLSGAVVAWEAAAGNIADRGVLRNVSPTRCEVEGYPRLVLLDRVGTPAMVVNAKSGKDAPLGSVALRPGEVTYLLSHPPRPSEVVLAPGDEAHFDFTYGDNPEGKQRTCPSIMSVAIDLPGGAARGCRRRSPTLAWAR